MPSFDVVSKVDVQEVRNAIDQAGREIATRFDFRDIDAKFDWDGEQIVLTAPSDFQIQQMSEILRIKLSKREIDVGALDYKPVEQKLHQATQQIVVKQGIDSKTAKDIVKLIKTEKFKVQASIQEDQVRVTGKKRDDLQEVIAFLRKNDVGLPLQFENFRD